MKFHFDVDCADEINNNCQLALERSGVESMSPTRPTSLFLEEASEMLIHEEQEQNNNETKTSRKKKKRRATDNRQKTFNELYVPTGENLGEGAFGSVLTYRHLISGKEYAVKIIDKNRGRSRQKVLKEVEIFHHCKGHENILQLHEYFEEDDRFYLIFEKMEGGTLLENIEHRGHLTEQEASQVIREIAKALDFLHQKGMAHRDLKPENVLCVKAGQLVPLKITDFDLGCGMILDSKASSPVTTPELLTPVGSAEFMAPEVVDVWQDQAWSYDKRCDLWSLGIITYIMLSGYPPFYGQCGEDCGWERGEACKDCQDMLFQRIQEGFYDFPETEWCNISDDAKDLIRHLLVKDAHLRYSAREVLQHPWVAQLSSMTQLATPRVLQRTHSVKELEAFAENAVAVNRLILRHMSISEVHAPAPTFRIGSVSEENISPHYNYYDSDDSKSSFDIDLEQPMMMLGLSPPGTSSLARRRSKKKGVPTIAINGESGSPDELPTPRSPMKVPSAIF